MSARQYAILMVLGLFPWFILQTQLSLNGDITWLITAAERFLDGQAMDKAYYESNPPLNIVYNALPVLMHRLMPFIPYYYVIICFFLGLIALGAAAVRAVLARWDFLDQDQKRLIVAAFVIANTIIVTVSVGEREQLVILGLMPFVMAQMSMSWGYALPRRVLWPILAAGTIGVLIKPHFGLIPVAALLYRMIVQKRFFSIVRDPDFLVLAVGTVGYAVLAWIYFPGFIHVILPDVVALYLPNKSYEYAVPQLFWHCFLFIVFLGLEAAFSPLAGRQKLLIIMLYTGALMALVPFAVQMKAYYYHLIPAIVFFLCAFALSLHSYASLYLGRMRKYVGALTLIALFALAYNNRPLMLEFPRHKDYATFPLTKEIAACGPDCSAFMFNDSIEMTQPTFFYLGKQNASRFPSFWFLPQIIKWAEEPEIAPLKRKYADMVGEDLATYKPDMLLIGQYWIVDGDALFDFPGFFSVSPLFEAEWSHYVKEKTITINRKAYFAGTLLGDDYPMTYVIYRRRN